MSSDVAIRVVGSSVSEINNIDAVGSWVKAIRVVGSSVSEINNIDAVGSWVKATCR